MGPEQGGFNPEEEKMNLTDQEASELVGRVDRGEFTAEKGAVIHEPGQEEEPTEKVNQEVVAQMVEKFKNIQVSGMDLSGDKADKMLSALKEHIKDKKSFQSALEQMGFQPDQVHEMMEESGFEE